MLVCYNARRPKISPKDIRQDSGIEMIGDEAKGLAQEDYR